MTIASRAFLVSLALTFIVLKNSWACKVKEEVEPTKDWWETAQFYQIYPRSFKDSDGDGIGDLKGITSQLEYLKKIGITATWLSPIFKSPMADFGYDISDFYDIQPEYGTMADFEELTKKAKELGIKIILDFVPNHSSDECEWFTKSIDGDEEYKDFYVWADGVVDPQNPTNRLPPSNWIQAFRGSAWKWVEKRKQFYLHQFAYQQPDLNYRNPKVVEKMKHVLRFWLDKGIDGYRVDAVPNMFEVLPNKDGTYLDEPKSGLTDDPENTNYLTHIYTQNQPETIDMVYQWRDMFDSYQRIHGGDTRVLLIETYAPPDYTMKFYGNRTTNGAQLPFNFNLITSVNKESNAMDIKNAIDKWLPHMPNGYTANWVIGNHDQKRSSTRYGVDKIDHMNMLVMILPGVSVTYQGEELGMLDGIISWKDTVDPAACNSNENIYEEFSRDPARTPFHWDSTKNAGFSTSDKTWLPMAPDYETINVASETSADKSHLKIYKALVQLRQNKVLQFGDYRYEAINDNVFAVLRTYKNLQPILYVANFKGNTETVDLTIKLGNLPEMKFAILSLSSEKTVGSKADVKTLKLGPYEAVILS